MGRDIREFFEKGREDITGTDFIHSARSAGLVETTVCRVSDTMTGQRFRKHS